MKHLYMASKSSNPVEFEFTGKKIQDYLDSKEPIEGKYYLSPGDEHPYKLIDRILKGSRTLLKREFLDGTVKESPLVTRTMDEEIFLNAVEKDEYPFAGLTAEQLAPLGCIIPSRTYF